jgi:hypothetical protein
MPEDGHLVKVKGRICVKRLLVIAILHLEVVKLPNVEFASFS